MFNLFGSILGLCLGQSPGSSVTSSGLARLERASLLSKLGRNSAKMASSSIFAYKNLKSYIPFILIFASSASYAETEAKVEWQVESTKGLETQAMDPVEKCLPLSKKTDRESAMKELEPLALEFDNLWFHAEKEDVLWHRRNVRNSCAKDVYKAFLKLCTTATCQNSYNNLFKYAIRVSSPWQRNTILSIVEKSLAINHEISFNTYNHFPWKFFDQLTAPGQNEFTERALARAIDISLKQQGIRFLRLANNIKTANQLKYFNKLLELYCPAELIDSSDPWDVHNKRTVVAPSIDVFHAWIVNLDVLDEQDAVDAAFVFQKFMGVNFYASIDSSSLKNILISKSKLLTETREGTDRRKALGEYETSLKRIMNGKIHFNELPDSSSPYAWEAIRYVLAKFPRTYDFEDWYESWTDVGTRGALALIGAYLVDSPEINDAGANVDKFKTFEEIYKSLPVADLAIIALRLNEIKGVPRTEEGRDLALRNSHYEYWKAHAFVVPVRALVGTVIDLAFSRTKDLATGRDPRNRALLIASQIQNPLALDSFRKMMDRVNYHDWSSAAYESVLKIQNENQKRRFDFILDHTGKLNWQNKVYWLATCDEMSELDEGQVADDFSIDGTRLRISYAESVFRMLVQSGSGITDWMLHVWDKVLNVKTKEDWAAIYNQIQRDANRDL